ncbi:MAG: DUF2971 domain-containing protein [Pseudomonadota bacterium]
MSSGPTLRRYTNVLALLDLLHHKRLTLLNPSKWYDQNDALGLRQYSKLKGEGSVYAACFAEGYEQAHHWQIFAGDSHGLAIVFDKEKLLAAFDSQLPLDDICHGPVQYKTLKEVRDSKPISIDDLPFLKRDTFKAEQEYRVVAWEENWLAGPTYSVPVQLDCINRVVLGPGMADSLARSLKEIAQAIEGCSNITFAKSRLVNNASWAESISDGLRGAIVS